MRRTDIDYEAFGDVPPEIIESWVDSETEEEEGIGRYDMPEFRGAVPRLITSRNHIPSLMGNIDRVRKGAGH